MDKQPRHPFADKSVVTDMRYVKPLWEETKHACPTPCPHGANPTACPTCFQTSSEVNPIQRHIVNECDAIKNMLLEKNKAYGSSFSNPLHVFAKGLSNEAQLLVRIDDKLSRISRGAAAGEDVVLDLIGYLVLLRVTRNRLT
jgi:hypothetical protein